MYISPTTLFLVLIGKFDKSQIFSPDSPELDLIRLSRAKRGGKYGAQEPRLVLHSFYKQLPQINLFLVLIRSLTKSQTFFPDWPEVGHMRAK